MAEHELDQFLSTSAIARRAAVEPRVVVRRFTADATALERAAAGGSIAVSASPLCELVAGDTVLARGEIVVSEGRHVFQVQEVVR